MSVSCPSSSFCVAVDNGGNGFVYNGSTWSGANIVNHVSNEEGIASVSCPSSAFCVAVGQAGFAETSPNGSTWSTPVAIDTNSLTSVSCPSSTFCVAGDRADDAVTYNGTSWTAPVTVDPVQSSAGLSVSCVASSFCAGIDGSMDAMTFDGSAWSAPVDIQPGSQLGPSVSCVSSSFCVAVDGAGHAFTYTTPATPPPGGRLPPPVLGKTVNAAPVSGVVFVKPPRGKSLDSAGDPPAAAAAGAGPGFVRLVAATKIPIGSEVNSLHGSLKLVTATGKTGKTQTGTFGGAIFKVIQASKGSSTGRVTLSLVEGAFNGAPTYGVCKPGAKAGDASAMAASSRVLQLLKASGHGRFSTRGRYSAATVRGTVWTVSDRCDGTLTHDITDSVSVTDFVRHKTIVLHAGQSYLAKAPTSRK